MKKLGKITDFDSIYKQGHRCRSGMITSWATLSPGAWNVGVVASKRRVSKKAVHRNRAKRRIKACIRNLISVDASALFSNALNLVISADRVCVFTTWSELSTEIRKQLQSHDAFFNRPNPETAQ